MAFDARLATIEDEAIPLVKVNNAIALDDLAVGPDATAGTTTDDDWEELVTPGAELTAMGVLDLLNANTGAGGSIRDSLISSNIQRAASAVTTSSSITALSDVIYQTIEPSDGQLLVWDEDRWTNSTVPTTGVSQMAFDARLATIEDEAIPLVKVNLSLIHI